ncbi:histidine phosphatase family protein [Elioraea tepida]|jgi:phosphohistidine phosphatase|uniref:Histidine phosphatase family protein n=1 Tax=Elioraea tepida TaxID=2843330 RepID=A0A975U3I1_9PROT|nr:histidine phosphatase family protein [Elioraea tepida]QXM25302.1 histidine phosphatase family protein [Elioraea tepida]
MRQLLLLRHAKSSWDDPGLPDHDRPLDSRGRRDAAAMGEAMRRLGLSPDIVLVSSARRTLETLAAIEPLEGSPLVDEHAELYLAPAEKMLAMLHAVPETARSVLLIGHNPGLHDLALALIGPSGLASGGEDARRLGEKYPTGALAEFAIATPWWGVEEGGGRLVRFLCPKDLPAAHG